jgi:acyl-CoA hydrolase
MTDGKTPEETSVVMTQLVLPGMTNLLGNLLGGQMMHWMDVAGALCCMRHCNMHVATIAVEALEFRHPVRQGEMVCLKAKLIWAGKTSMKVKITATAENLATGATIVTNVAKYTFVALDKEGRKAAVPRLLPQTDEEKADYAIEEAAYRSRASGG